MSTIQQMCLNYVTHRHTAQIRKPMHILLQQQPMPHSPREILFTVHNTVQRQYPHKHMVSNTFNHCRHGDMFLELKAKGQAVELFDSSKKPYFFANTHKNSTTHTGTHTKSRIQHIHTNSRTHTKNTYKKSHTNFRIQRIHIKLTCPILHLTYCNFMLLLNIKKDSNNGKSKKKQT